MNTQWIILNTLHLLQQHHLHAAELYLNRFGGEFIPVRHLIQQHHIHAALRLLHRLLSQNTAALQG